MAVYANQWRFRLTRGLVYNGDFYYNKGSLDGNKMIRQFIDVIASYEFIEVKIYGILSDGVGGYAKFV